jgi:FPC/CPF motif-containing protein YcgG
MHAFHHAAHDYFKKLVLAEDFACVGAQAAVKSHKYVFAAYSSMNSKEVAQALYNDIQKYKKEFDLSHVMEKPHASFLTFVAAFDQSIDDQMDGVIELYNLFHDLADSPDNWASNVSNDLSSSDFGFSVGGDAFFVPFLYEYSGSPARHSKIPMLVFNAHDMFTKLRSVGSFDKLKAIIHARQAWIHPHLGDHGEAVEFVQYALVDPDEKSQKQEQFFREHLLGTKPFTKENAHKGC